MEFVALVTLLLIFQYMTFMMLCGMARAKGDVKAPATSGDEMYTVEQLVITLPAMWICAMYYRPLVAAALGLVFFLGRLLYRTAYMRDPTKRGPGMIVGFLANVGLMLTALWGVVIQM
jgi:small-conductance mechanosensitive channel